MACGRRTANRRHEWVAASLAARQMWGGEEFDGDMFIRTGSLLTLASTAPMRTDPELERKIQAHMRKIEAAGGVFVMPDDPSESSSSTERDQ